jgi:hypothetical protein
VARVCVCLQVGIVVLDSDLTTSVAYELTAIACHLHLRSNRRTVLRRTDHAGALLAPHLGTWRRCWTIRVLAAAAVRDGADALSAGIAVSLLSTVPEWGTTRRAAAQRQDDRDDARPVSTRDFLLRAEHGDAIPWAGDDGQGVEPARDLVDHVAGPQTVHCMGDKLGGACS